MTARDGQPDDEVSLFAIGTVLLRNRWRIARWALAGGLIALAMVFQRPKLYTGSLSFVPQGTDASRSGLASLAGQLGIPTSMGIQSQQPDFYLSLLQSRELLLPIVRDTFTVQENGGKRVAFLDLFEIPGSGAYREEIGTKRLRGMISASPVKNTGIVRVTVKTKWPGVSLRISEILLDGVNAFNVRTRQSQAASERRFVEGRLTIAKDSLRVAEDRVQEFLIRNRSGVNESPQLNSAWQRLEREVGAKTAIVTALTQESEDVRIREVRDTPTITVFESPSVSSVPEPRRRAMSTLLGLILGAGFGVLLTLLSAIGARRDSIRDPDASEFFVALNQMTAGLRARLRLPARRAPD